MVSFQLDAFAPFFSKAIPVVIIVWDRDINTIEKRWLFLMSIPLLVPVNVRPFHFLIVALLLCVISYFFLSSLLKPLNSASINFSYDEYARENS